MALSGPWAGPGRSGRSGDEQEAREAARKVKRGVSRNQPGSAITRGQIHLYSSFTWDEKVKFSIYRLGEWDSCREQT